HLEVLKPVASRYVVGGVLTDPGPGEPESGDYAGQLGGNGRGPGLAGLVLVDNGRDVPTAERFDVDLGEVPGSLRGGGGDTVERLDRVDVFLALDQKNGPRPGVEQ